MTIGPTAGDAQPPPSRVRVGRVSRRTAGLLLVAVVVLAACAFGIRAVWPASSSARLATETNDNGYFIVIDRAGKEVGSGSATQLPEAGDDVHVEVWGSLAPRRRAQGRRYGGERLAECPRVSRRPAHGGDRHQGGSPLADG